MTTILAKAAAALLATTAFAQAGGIERAAFNPGFLFEKGNYVELSFGMVSPSVSGSIRGVVKSGDMAETYTVMSGSMKQDISEDFALGLVIDQPVGVNIAYPSGTNYPFAGTSAKVTSTQVTGLGIYRFSSNMSAYAGLRANLAKGEAKNVPILDPPTSYTMQTESNLAYGYLVGVAYERPEIALRVALTYVSALTHDFEATDTFGTGADFSTTISQSVNLDFQTGIAANTLAFGSIKWRDWSSFDIIPRGSIPLSSDNSDTITYTLGVGRKFSDAWSGAVSVGYEPPVGGFAGNLGPTDGYKSLSLAGIHTLASGAKITVGASYGVIGDAETGDSDTPPATLGTFTDNHFAGVGVKVGWNF